MTNYGDWLFIQVCASAEYLPLGYDSAGCVQPTVGVTIFGSKRFSTGSTLSVISMTTCTFIPEYLYTGLEPYHGGVAASVPELLT